MNDIRTFIYTLERSFQELKVKKEMIELAIEQLQNYNNSMDQSLNVLGENLKSLLGEIANHASEQENQGSPKE